MNNLEVFDARSECSSVSSCASDFSDTCSHRFLKYEFVVGSRKSSNLLYTTDENQFYRFNKHNKSGDVYLCAEKNCNSRVHIRKDKLCIQQVKYMHHRHETKEKKYEELNVLNLIKTKCCDLSTLINERKQSVRDICLMCFYFVTANYPHVKIDFFAHERSLQLIRNAALPRTPVSCD